RSTLFPYTTLFRSIIIPRQRHNSLTWFGAHHSKCCRACPTQRSSLTGLDPRPWTVGMQHLCPGDLAEANGGHIRNVAAESTVHSLIYPPRLDGTFIATSLALQLTGAGGTAGRPGGMQRLCPGDLAEANGGHIRNVAAESTVHFLIYPLWFDGFFIVMRLALQLTFTCGTAGRPGGIFRY